MLKPFLGHRSCFWARAWAAQVKHSRTQKNERSLFLMGQNYGFLLAWAVFLM